MQASRPGLWSLVAVPAVLTLIVSVVRLVGELQGWNPSLFGTSAGGGGSLVGISWLALVFGFWFGWRLRRGDTEVAPLRAGIIYLFAVGVFAGGLFALTKLGYVVFPAKDAPGELQGLPYILGAMLVAVLVALAAWPRLGLTLILYALLARIPVVVITWFAVQNNWDTHYAKLGPGIAATSTTDQFYKLSMAQVTFWPLFTVLAGGVAGCLGAAFARPGKANR